MKSGHTHKFSRKKSKNWIFTGQKTFMNKNQNILEFSIFDKKTVHEASKLSIVMLGYILKLHVQFFCQIC